MDNEAMLARGKEAFYGALAHSGPFILSEEAAKVRLHEEFISHDTESAYFVSVYGVSGKKMWEYQGADLCYGEDERTIAMAHYLSRLFSCPLEM